MTGRIVTLASRELATVLAALRLWQQTVNRLDSDCEDGLADIATDGGAFEPLDEDEIDGLCERINGGDDPL
jgi:hypothetical protein